MTMTQEELKDIARCGETTTIQFKELFAGQKEIAKEMVAFANTLGGQIFFGIKDKTGELVGLSYDEIQTISRELGNAANEQVRPTIYINTDVVRADGKHFLVCTVAQGKNKPYKNLNGEIWVKQGADKRRITENSEILALFQDSGSYQADAAGVTDTNFNDLDRYALNDYLKKVYALPQNDPNTSGSVLPRNPIDCSPEYHPSLSRSNPLQIDSPQKEQKLFEYLLHSSTSWRYNLLQIARQSG